ncbi:Putative HTH-type transcriptional regulator [Thermoflexales bacterium]|nr:Putative HTH-type transcriptional regulator [Thermoflexales bacterium]
MALLKIELLGAFRVARDGQPVTGFETDAARALLAYLVMQAGAPFRRETLADLLWPSQPASKALGNLRKTLSRLRSALQDQNADHPLIEVTREAICLNTDSNYWLDVAAFTDLIDTSQQHPHWRVERCATCLSGLQTAAELYRGDFLTDLNLDSLPFQEWLTLIREQLFQQAMGILDRLAAYHLQRGTYDAARHWAWRQLELESWCEEAHRQLMRSLALSGQRSAALAQYDTCHRILTAQLGITPSVETIALFEQIRAGNFASDRPFQANLPLNLTAFVGREAELKQIVETLQNPNCRLLTLLGLGGMGKTRLALQVVLTEGWMYRDGVCFVPLAGLTSPDHVMTALAQNLQFVPDPKHGFINQLRNYLRRKEMLLVFDAVEHVLAAAQQITELLEHAPQVQVLATSRERLHTPGEWVYEIGGLTYPLVDQSDSPTHWSAVQLFTQGARRVQPNFSAEESVISHICQLVAGMPLAIELAAAWVRTLACHDIAQEIERDLGFLHSRQYAGPEQQRSLRAVFDSSWMLLTAQEHTLLSQLAVFRGGFDRVAASAISGASPVLLAALLDKAWLRQEALGAEQQVRYQLHDLVQRYASEKLAESATTTATVRDRHCQYYMGWLQQQAAALKGGAQRAALNEMDVEIKNVRAAWEWALTQHNLRAIELAWESLFLFYDLRSWFQEGESIFKELAQALPEPQTDQEKLLLGRALICQGRLASRTGQNVPAQALIQHAITLLPGLNAQREMALALNYLGVILLTLGLAAEARERCQASLLIFQKLDESCDTAMALNNLGEVAFRQGDFSEAQRRCRESLELARAAGLQQIEADSLRQLGFILFNSDSTTEASAYLEQALHRYRELNNPWGESSVLNYLGGIFHRLGDDSQACAYLEQVSAIKQKIGDRQGEAHALNNLGSIASDLGDYIPARAYYEQALTIFREIGDRLSEARTLDNMGVMLAQQADWVSAWACLDQALHIRREIGNKQGEAISLMNLGDTLMRQGDYGQAQNQLEQGLSIFREVGDQWGIAQTSMELGLLFQQVGEYEVAQKYSQQALQLAEAIDARTAQSDALTCLGHALTGLGRLAEAADIYQRALDLRLDLGQPNRAMETRAGLARVALAQGDLVQAQNHVTEILNYLQAATLDGTEEPVRIYLTCYLVLNANQDPRAPEILTTAYGFLQKRASRTSSERTHRSFLEQVPSHRELLAEWTKYGDRGLQSDSK